MTNLLSHYQYYFSSRSEFLEKRTPFFPHSESELLPKSSINYGASNFYEFIHKNLVNIYKRDQFLDNSLFNFFYSIEKLLNWSPMLSYHKFDNTSYLSESDAIKVLKNNSIFNTSAKINSMEIKTFKNDILLSFKDVDWDQEFHGVYFFDYFLIFLLFWFTDIIACEADWFLVHMFVYQKDLGVFMAGDSLSIIFENFYFNFFSSSYIIEAFFDNMFELFLYVLSGQWNPNINDTEDFSRLFFFSFSDNFEENVFWDTFDWWHDEFFLFEDDEFEFDSCQIWKEEEDENPDFRSDIFLDIDESGNLQDKFYDWTYKYNIRGAPWYELKKKLYFLRWKRHYTYFTAEDPAHGDTPIILKHSDYLHEPDMFDNWQFDGPLFFEYGDFDWYYLIKIYDIADWNYQSILPMSSFYFFFNDYFIDYYDHYDYMHAEISGHISFMTSYYLNFEYFMYLVDYYYKGFVIYDLIPNIKDHPWYFSKVLFWQAISKLAEVNNVGNGDLFTFLFVADQTAINYYFLYNLSLEFFTINLIFVLNSFWFFDMVDSLFNFIPFFIISFNFIYRIFFDCYDLFFFLILIF